MPEKNINVQFANYIKENFAGDTQKNILNFVQHLTLIGMTIGGSFNDSHFSYKGKTVCYTYFGSSSNTPGYPEPWTIWMPDEFGKEMEGVPIDDRMKEVTWANVHNCDENCPHIKNGCSGQRKIFEREFIRLCRTPIGFTDPDSEAVECAKKLMEMRKHAIDNGK